MVHAQEPLMINSQRRFLRKYKRDDTNLLPTFDGRFSFSFYFILFFLGGRGEGGGDVYAPPPFIM